MKMSSPHTSRMPHCPPGYRLWWNGHAYQCVPMTAPPPQIEPPRTGFPVQSPTVRQAHDMRRAIPRGIRPSATAMVHPRQRHLSGVGQAGDLDTAATAWGALSTASLGLSAYHGYKRNDSIGWAVWWGLMGGIFPVLTPAIALAQGFGERKRG